MSGRTPSPRRVRSPSAKSAPMKRVSAGRLGGEALEARLRGGVAVDADQRPLRPERGGDEARVAAAAEGAVDGGLARLRGPAGRSARGRGRVRARSACRQGLRCFALGSAIGDVAAAWACISLGCSAEARPSAISGAAASSSSSCLAQASAFQISRYSPAPITTQGPARPACSISGLGTRIRPAESSFSSKEPPWKRRRRLRASLPKGLCGREEALGELLELLGRMHPDAGVEALGENNSVGERGAEARRNREAILGVEAVLVETPKCHPRGFLSAAVAERVRTGVMRWEEPHHPGPGLQLERHTTPLPPTLQHDLGQHVPIATSLHAARPRRSAVTVAMRRRMQPRPCGPSRLAAVANRPEDATALPDDADDLRGFHFKRLLGKPLTWVADSWSRSSLAARRRRRSSSAPAIGAARRAAASSCSALLIVFAIADSRAEDAFFATYAAAARDGAVRQAGRCRRRRRCCARATTATPSGPSPGRSPTESTASSPSTPTRRRRPTARATRQTNYYRYTVGLAERARVRRLRPRALLPAQVRPARPGEARGRLPPLQRAGRAGERGARRALRDLRRQGARTRTGCASSSPPPSSSG